MITLHSDSRYKDSFAYLDDGEIVIGPMQLPAEFATVSPSWLIHTVSSREVGFPDIIAHRYYGAGNEKLWWIICLVNGIVDPDTDMVAGQRISIPPQDVVSRFIARVPRA